MKEKILEKLRKLEKEKNIKIIFAVESGSREWGFASDDSDYDVRCVHVSNENNYLSLFTKNEQVDLLEDNIDIVSWDIRKFFNLFLKSNPTVSEWLSSKLIYVSKDFNKIKKEDLHKIFSEGFSRSKIKQHYISLAKQNYEKYINKDSEVSLKKYVYILRAFGCIEYINNTNSLPPLNWKLSSKFLSENICKIFSELVELKKNSESTKGKRNETLDRWIEQKLNEKVEKQEDHFNIDFIDKLVIETIKQYS